MAQTQWTYHGPSGRSYHIGLYHGDESGHVIIYCNNNILTIDFDVREDKSYSFYLERDLCELSLSQEGEHFEYDFQIAQSEEATSSSSDMESLDYIYIWLVAILFMGIIISVAIAISPAS
jgi:hypothetical protein